MNNIFMMAALIIVFWIIIGIVMRIIAFIANDTPLTSLVERIKKIFSRR